MKHWIMAAALLLLPGMSVRPSVDHLGWMSGRWVEEGPDRWTEENWSRPRGGVMLGTSLTGKGPEAGMFEFMRIAEGEGPAQIVFWASPRGAAAVPFPMVREGLRDVAFENPRNDYPTRIQYSRKGHVLTATISGPGGANPMSWRFRRRGN